MAAETPAGEQRDGGGTWKQTVTRRRSERDRKPLLTQPVTQQQSRCEQLSFTLTKHINMEKAKFDIESDGLWLLLQLKSMAQVRRENTQRHKCNSQ